MRPWGLFQTCRARLRLVLPGAEAAKARGPRGCFTAPPLPPLPLKRSQERRQVRFFLLGEADAETVVVEFHDRTEIGRRAVVEIGRARGERAQHRTLELAHVLPLAGDERAAGI